MTGRHYDLDVLADLAEGLLDDETTKAVRGHLTQCPQCSAHQADLAEVTRMLATAPPPVLPASLATRLDEALLAEATRGAAVVDLASRRRAGRMARFVSVAAAAVVVSGVGVFALTNGSLDEAHNDGSAALTPPVPSHTAVASGTDYQAEDLRALRTNQRGTAQGITLDAQQIGCLGRTVPSGKPVFVDVAEYQGVPAMIIVAGGTVYVTGPNCSADVPDLLAEVRADAN